MAWKELNVNPRIIQAVEDANLDSFTNVLISTTGELQRLTKLSSKDVEYLKKAVSEVVVFNPPTSVIQLLKNPAARHKTDGKLSTGCIILNRFLQGGILIQRLTEIAGESGSGKTQLCLQLALNAQLPKIKGGLDGGVAYICTEDGFPNKRLKQMSTSFQRHHSEEKINFTDNFFIHHVADLERLKLCLKHQLPALIKLKKVKLVILDSVAVIFRSDYDAKDIFVRSQDIQWFGSQLHHLCLNHEVTVICTNQITDVVTSDHPIRKSIPSLGLSWSNFITTRLMFRRTSMKVPLPLDPENSLPAQVTQSVVRTVDIVFAPHLPKTSCNFMVDYEGIKGLEINS